MSGRVAGPGRVPCTHAIAFLGPVGRMHYRRLVGRLPGVKLVHQHGIGSIPQGPWICAGAAFFGVWVLWEEAQHDKQACCALPTGRYNKGLMLLGLLVEKAGPRCWRGKWLNPARALHSPDSIPQEPLQYLARWARSFFPIPVAQDKVGMVPQGCFP